MTTSIPFYISALFLLSVFFCLWVLSLILNRSSISLKAKSKITYGCIGWILLQVVLTRSGMYHSHLDSMPPMILLLGVLPTLLCITYLFVTEKGKIFLDSLPVTHLHYIHLVRIPVEFTLYGLFLYQAVPQLMTFEGRNFDILAGISAPVFTYFCLVKQQNHRLLLWWNMICLGLLLNIVVNAVFSAPFPLQLFAFDQPNVAVLYFPYSLLPTFIVPLVLFSHLASIRALIKGSKKI